MIQNKIMNIQTTNQLAKEYFDKKEFHKALTLLQNEDLPEELIPNLAKCYYYTNQANKALDLILPLQKTQNLWIDTALYYNAIGQHDKAFEIYKNLDQTDPKVKFNIGWHYLRNNNFQKGFENLSYGNQCRSWGNEYIYIEKGVLNPSKRWTGEFCNNLILILEGGLGDEIIFLRWSNWLKTQCNNLTILCSRSLLRLFINAGYDCVPIDLLENIHYDKYVPAMSLPEIAKLKTPKQYVEFPYINSFSEKYIIKQMNLIAGNKKKIGVRFYGNKEFEHDQFRTPPRQELEKLSKFGQLFSLQLEEEQSNIPNCNYLIKDWQDTYSVFSGLDFLVTSCTSTAHLAGAMGIRAFVLVPLVPYFVWASDKLTWYENNITVIRQTKYNDWTECINCLNEELEKL